MDKTMIDVKKLNKMSDKELGLLAQSLKEVAEKRQLANSANKKKARSQVLAEAKKLKKEYAIECIVSIKSKLTLHNFEELLKGEDLISSEINASKVKVIKGPKGVNKQIVADALEQLINGGEYYEAEVFRNEFVLMDRYEKKARKLLGPKQWWELSGD